MLKSWVSALAVAALGLAAADQWDARVDSIMSTFTAEDMVGQMTQVALYWLVDRDYNLDEDAVRAYAKLKVGSYISSQLAVQTYSGENVTYAWTAEQFRAVVTRIQEITMKENGGHPMIFGLDSVHGANLVLNTVLFGQQINGAASFNPDLVYKAGEVTARDTLAAGIPWAFSPILEVNTNQLWARTYETFGEDPHLASIMGDAIIRGIQSNNATAACMKHFIGYSKTPTGHDTDGVTVTDFDLLNYFAPPFLAAIDAGVLTAMENYISVNGVPTIQSTKLLKALLRHDMGYERVIVSDFAEIDAMQRFHRVARTTDEATKFSLERTSIDMNMMGFGYTFFNGTKALLEENPGIVQRMRESARRIVKLKVQLGLYDNPVPGKENLPLIGNADDVAAALELARESVVLLQNNDSTLPLASGTPVFLTGHMGDNIVYQCGGWTITGGGIPGKSNFPLGVSVKDGLEAIVGNNSVSYFNGLYANGTYSEDDLATAKNLASQSEYTIAVIGEEPYTEKAGDIDDLALPAGQIEYVKAIASTGTKVILVLFEGRPRLLGGLTKHVYAVVNGLLACELGGQAVAEIIYGKVDPSGRMPITYSKDPANVAIPYNHRVTTQCASRDYCEMQWDFGHGLSYTTFDYSNLTLSKSNVTSSSDTVDVTVTVTNSGAIAGKETVMLFLTQPYRSFSVPEVKMLKKFSKVSLGAGESTTVAFTLAANDWSVYYPQIGSGFLQVAEDTDYVVVIKPETDCDVYNTTAAANPLCATITLNTGEYPYGVLTPLE